MTRVIASISFMLCLIGMGQCADLIKQARKQISQLNISFYKNNYPLKSSTDELSVSIGKLLSQEEIPESIKSQKDYKAKINKLAESYKKFRQFYQTKPELDTLKKTFRYVNNSFNSLYGEYFLNELRKSSKPGIIIFSTSLSCECTLDECYKQETEVELLEKENPGLLEYAVIDAYENSELKDKYKVGFIPTVILQDSNYKEIQRLIRMENLYTEMKPFIITNKLK